jgi:hypothetical protein
MASQSSKEDNVLLDVVGPVDDEPTSEPPSLAFQGKMRAGGAAYCLLLTADVSHRTLFTDNVARQPGSRSQMGGPPDTRRRRLSAGIPALRLTKELLCGAHDDVL